MANLLNLDAEAGADFRGDDAEPALTLSNSSTGPGLRVLGIVATSTASIDEARIGTIEGGNLSIAPVRIVSSGASFPALSVETGGFASITSVVLTTVANTDFAIRVKVGVGTADQFRWIPLFKDAGLVGTAAV